MNVLNIALPLIATVFGGVLTYLLNRRWRRTTRIEDMYIAAEAAVYGAAAAVEYTWPAKHDHLTADESEELNKWFISESLKQWHSKIAEANLALARLAPICPEVKLFLPFRVTRDDQIDPQLLKVLSARSTS